MKMTEFFLPMKPPTITAQQKGVKVVKGKPRFYEKQEVKDVREKFMAHLAKHRIDKPMTGPVRLTIKWLFPMIKGKSDGQYKDTKPDTDNLLKLLKDVMEYLEFYKNDSQVASEINEKFWAEIPGIYIRVEEIG